jgi:hypothetical protein
MSIETALVYIYAIEPTKRFIGCGALIECPAIVTCRHVWQAAAKDAKREPIEVEVEHPHATRQTRRAALLDACAEGDEAPPDAVLLTADDPPARALPLHLAPALEFVYGSGYAVTGILGRERARPNHIAQISVPGDISPRATDEGRHQFTGTKRDTYWFAHRSSGSPVFRENGSQLAGIVSLSETGERPGEAEVHEAFIVPATAIIPHAIRVKAKLAVAREQGVDPRLLAPLFEHLGQAGVTPDEMRTRAGEAIEAILARARKGAAVE